MNILDSPMEALALNPVNLGPLLTAAINSLWAWLAVVTAAAFSFWRLRTTAASAKPRSSPPSEPSTTPSPSTHDSEPNMTSFGGQKKEEIIPAVATTSFGGQITKEEEGVLTRGDSFKNRFTMTYYQEEERENDDDDGGNDEMDGGDEAVLVKRWTAGRGLTVEIARRGFGLEWYGYQDRGVIDGCVVKLWEERESSYYSSARSCRRRSPVGVTGLIMASPLVFA